ncbi:hypothetical protein LOAG_04481 [Loa loa]|uniref:Uncharacterized protein n=1 Tax=Loa loa TaxID=7209 RepID=A0A1S0U1X8_LOALO|nr:hypothetical protein LOAG_04481 [Loa loa]EFO24004.1 hypothetical protein LOAG_04481 [Loa loa]
MKLHYLHKHNLNYMTRNYYSRSPPTYHVYTSDLIKPCTFPDYDTHSIVSNDPVGEESLETALIPLKIWLEIEPNLTEDRWVQSLLSVSLQLTFQSRIAELFGGTIDLVQLNCSTIEY